MKNSVVELFQETRQLATLWTIFFELHEKLRIYNNSESAPELQDDIIRVASKIDR